jgi:hypothetical protein
MTQYRITTAGGRTYYCDAANVETELADALVERVGLTGETKPEKSQTKSQTKPARKRRDVR